jgi:hypothetical protein
MIQVKIILDKRAQTLPHRMAAFTSELRKYMIKAMFLVEQVTHIISGV